MIGLVRLLVVHLMLDRSVTAVLAVRFLDRRLLAPPSKIEAAVAPLPMSRRMQLAQASRLISNSCAKDMKTVNRVRNKLAHYDPRSGWGVRRKSPLSRRLNNASTTDSALWEGMEVIGWSSLVWKSREREA